MRLLALPVVAIEILFCWVRGAWFMFRHPIRHRNFMHAYGQTMKELQILEDNWEFRRLPRKDKGL